MSDDQRKEGVNRGNAGKGRPKGSPNKTTALLKDAILQAAERAGGPEGLVGYLEARAIDTPGPFMALLGKVLPTQLAGDPDNPIRTKLEADEAFAAFARSMASVAAAAARGADEAG